MSSVSNANPPYIPIRLDVMDDPDYVDLFLRGLKSLNYDDIAKLIDIEKVFHKYRNEKSENPIVTCLQSYLESRSKRDCPNPIRLLRTLLEVDKNMDEVSGDGEEIQKKLNILIVEMSEGKYAFDQQVVDLVNEYRVFELDTSETDDSDEFNSNDCQAADSDDREEIHSSEGE